VANGAVRCGSCLRVFNAQAHLLNRKKTSDNILETPAASLDSQKKVAQTTTENTTPATHSTPKNTVSAISLVPAIKKSEDTDDSNSNNNNNTDKHYESVSTAFTDSSSANDGPDESWALKLLRESEATDALLASPQTEDASTPHTPLSIDLDDNNPTISARKIDEALDEAENLFIDIINNDLQDSSAEEGKETTERTDDSWAEDLLVDENTDPAAAFVLSHSTIDISNAAATKASENSPIDQELPAEAPKLNLQFERDDISFSEEKTKVKRWPWLVACLPLLMVLAAQIAWVQFDTWSNQAPYRPYYAKVCEILSCQLADMSNISQIRSTHLVVRSHPDEENALIVDAIIANTADFRQPFPGIRLIFLDIEGRVVASRDFQPEEYVKGELFGETLMPARQSIQLSLSIIDPGDKAVNYRLDIVPPAPKS